MTAIPGRRGSGSKAMGLGTDAEELKLEAQLHELRGLMAKEREKRAAVRENEKATGSIWGSGKPGGLRGRSAVEAVKAKAGSRRASEAAAGAPVAAGSAVSAVRSRESSRPGTPTSASASAPASQPASPPQPPAPQAEDVWVPPWAMAGRLAPPPQLAKPVSPSPRKSPGEGGKSRVEVVYDLDDNLGDGAFDEDESHASFLAALSEWRNGGKPTEPEPRKAAPSAATTAAAAAPKLSVADVMETQTETAPPLAQTARAVRPASAKGSMFARMQMKQASKELAFQGKQRDIPVKELPVPPEWEKNLPPPPAPGPEDEGDEDWDYDSDSDGGLGAGVGAGAGAGPPLHVPSAVRGGDAGPPEEGEGAAAGGEGEGGEPEPIIVFPEGDLDD